MHNNHYDVITKMPGFFASVYYCHTCKKAYNNHEDHRCPNACKCCRFPSECPEVSWQTCNDCYRLFKSQQCYEQHKQSRGDARSVCQSLVKCTKCQKVVRKTSMRTDKVLDLWQICATRRSSVFYSTRDEKEKTES